MPDLHPFIWFGIGVIIAVLLFLAYVGFGAGHMVNEAEKK